MGFLNLIIYVLVSLAAGSVFIVLSFNSLDLVYIAHSIDKQISSGPSTVTLFNLLIPTFIFVRASFFIAGFIIILFCIRYLQRMVYRRERSVISESNYGKVSITLFAIEDMLKNVLETERSLSHVRPKVVVGKRGIDVIIRANLNSEVNLASFANDVQQKAKEKMQNLLGEEKEIKVKLEIRKMVFKGKKKIVEEEEPEIPYRYY